MSVLRQSLWPGLLNVLQYNIKRQQSRCRLFEIGHVFPSSEKLNETTLISGVIYGNIYK